MTVLWVSPRRLSAAYADRRMARRYRLNPRPAFAPPARHRPWRARARGHGAAAGPTAAPLRAALRHSRRQHQLQLQLQLQLRRQPRRQRQHQLPHQVLSPEIAACSWAVQLSSVTPLTIKILASRAAPAILIPMSGEYHVPRAAIRSGGNLGATACNGLTATFRAQRYRYLQRSVAASKQ